MPRNILRSLLFNLYFYVLTALACIVCLPTLALPRRYFMGVVHGFVHTVWFLERTILNLNMEVRGLEHLPKDGAYIIAAKHQSAYETLKLHILFKDPAVILKKELLSIPLWGLYLKKSDPIAIDRSSPKMAIKSMQNGACRVKEQGRPIIIFPQGTRVSPDTTPKEKPYKSGITRIQEATDLPIIPMALNSGLFWPKGGFLKSSGAITIKFLPPIKPGGKAQKTLKTLEKTIEEETISLMNEAREKASEQGTASGQPIKIALLLLTILFGIYSYGWFKVAERSKAEYIILTQNLVPKEQPRQAPKISGYPGKIKLSVGKEQLQNQNGTITIENLRIEGWPIPYLPINLAAGPIIIKHFKWQVPLHFDSLMGTFTPKGKLLEIESATLKKETFIAQMQGTLDFNQKQIPRPDLKVIFKNYNKLLQNLSNSKIIKPQIALFLGAGFSSLADEAGQISIPIHQKGRTIKAGPFPIMTLDPQLEFDAGLGARLRPIP